MESLKEKREQAADEYGKHIVDNWHSLGTYKVADFRAGWDACQKEMEGRANYWRDKFFELQDEINKAQSGKGDKLC